MYELPVSPTSHTPDHFLFSLSGQGPQISINQTLRVSLPLVPSPLPVVKTGRGLYPLSAPIRLQWLYTPGGSG